MDKFTAFLMTSFLLILFVGFENFTDAVWIPPCHKVVKRNARIEKRSTPNKAFYDSEIHAESTDHENRKNEDVSLETENEYMTLNLEDIEKLEQDSMSGGFLVIPSGSSDNPWKTFYIPQLHTLLPKGVVNLLSSGTSDPFSVLPEPDTVHEIPQNYDCNEDMVPRSFRLYLQGEPKPIIYQDFVPITSPDVSQKPLSLGQAPIPSKSLAQNNPVSVIYLQSTPPPSVSTYAETLTPPSVTTPILYAYSNTDLQYEHTDINFYQNVIPVQRNFTNLPTPIQPDPVTFVHTNPNCPYYTSIEQNSLPPGQQQTYQYVQSSR